MEKIISPSKIKLSKEYDNGAIFIIEPCYPGYGVTLGNALRRVLLSSLPGSAPTAVKIENAEHEFSTLKDVKENVIEIILNIKKLIVKLNSEEPVRILLEKKGKGDILASDFKKDSNVEIQNPDLKIATATSKDTEFKMEVVVDNGRGYIPVESQEKDESEIGLIAIDSLYTPIVSVGYKVENMRVEQRTDYDRLIINIETNGIVTPKEALANASNILIQQLESLSDVKVIDKKIKEAKKEKVKKVEVKKEEKTVEDTPIQELNFSTRTFNALDKAKIRVIRDLFSRTDEELLDLEGFGKSALSEVKNSLKKAGIKQENTEEKSKEEDKSEDKK